MTDSNLPQDLTLLLVDDDKPFLTRLARAMETRGFSVRMAETVADGVEQVKKEPPGYAVVDLRLGDGNGLDVIEALHRSRPDARAVVLTGYGNIATAVTAVKLGAIDYLAKPADADAVYSALTGSGGARECERHGLAPRGMEQMLGRIALDLRPPAIGDDKAGFRRHDLGR
jgi:two-component system response regulator RegA